MDYLHRIKVKENQQIIDLQNARRAKLRPLLNLNAEELKKL